jgi:uncharacterized protein
MDRSRIDIDHEEIASFCRRHHIVKLAFFGSVLREDFGEDSDVDVLVEFHPEHVPGLFALSGMELELSGILGRKVDLRTANDLSLQFRNDVVRDAAVQYLA